MEEVELPLVCTCKPPGVEAADALREEVMMRLSNGGSEELGTGRVTMANFLTSIVQSFERDHDAHITSIDTDHWSAVTVEKYDGTLRVRAECDRVEDGLAAIWKALTDGPPYPEDGQPHPPPDA